MPIIGEFKSSLPARPATQRTDRVGKVTARSIALCPYMPAREILRYTSTLYYTLPLCILTSYASLSNDACRLRCRFSSTCSLVYIQSMSISRAFRGEIIFTGMATTTWNTGTSCLSRRSLRQLCAWIGFASFVRGQGCCCCSVSASRGMGITPSSSGSFPSAHLAAPLLIRCPPVPPASGQNLSTPFRTLPRLPCAPDIALPPQDQPHPAQQSQTKHSQQ